MNVRLIIPRVLGPILFLLPVGLMAQTDGEDHSQHEMAGHATHTGAADHIHHRHQQGDWMFEYRYMRMSMDGLLDGTDSVDSRDISGALPGTPPTRDPSRAYMMAPVDMTMDMHMVMLMYGLTPRLSLMAMGSYLDNDMTMVMHMPALDMTGDMQTDGLGDSLLGAMYVLDDAWTASISVSIPTGSVDETVTMTMTGTNPMNGAVMSVTNTTRAPYPMQLGSGTWDLIPAITYARSRDQLGWGGQASYVWHTGENSEDYTAGDALEAFGWVKYAANNRLMLAGKLRVLDRDRVSGRDPALNPAMSPSADPAAQGGTWVDVSAGLNLFVGKGHSLGVEFGIPVYQDLNGPQLERDWIVSLTYQFMP